MSCCKTLHTIGGVELGDLGKIKAPLRCYMPGQDRTGCPGASHTSGATKYYDNIKQNGGKQYTLMHDNTWWVLGVNGNRWSDPGRCWEPRVTGHWDNSAGHVLSQNCNQGHDAHSCGSDKYYVYVTGF